MAADDGESSASFPFKLLAVWRYVVVSVVTALAVVVIIKTMSPVLRPEELRLVVTRGAVRVDIIPLMPPKKVTFRFTLLAYNPGDNDIFYTNISVRLFASTSTSAKTDLITEFPFPVPFRVPPQVPQESLVTAKLTPPGDVPMEYVWTVYDENLVDAAMRIDGDLLVTSLQSPTRHVTYYCWPLTVGYYPSSNDVSCFQGIP